MVLSTELRIYIAPPTGLHAPMNVILLNHCIYAVEAGLVYGLEIAKK